MQQPSSGDDPPPSDKGLGPVDDDLPIADDDGKRRPGEWQKWGDVQKRVIDRLKRVDG